MTRDRSGIADADYLRPGLLRTLGAETTGIISRLVRTYSPPHLDEAAQTTTYDSNNSGTFDTADLSRVLTRQYDYPVILVCVEVVFRLIEI